MFDGSVLQYYSAVHQYLVYAKLNRWFSPGPALLRLQDELTLIEGSVGLDHPFIRNIPTRGIVSIETFSSGIYTCDGTSALKPVAGSTKAAIGEYPKVYDLVGQHRGIVLATRGLYELTAEGHLNRLPLPSELEGAKFNQLLEIRNRISLLFSPTAARSNWTPQTDCCASAERMESVSDHRRRYPDAHTGARDLIRIHLSQRIVDDFGLRQGRRSCARCRTMKSPTSARAMDVAFCPGFFLTPAMVVLSARQGTKSRLVGLRRTRAMDCRWVAARDDR